MTRIFFNPNRFVGTMLLSLLALLPSIVHLIWLALPATNPLLAVGPLAAGFGLAARFSRTHSSFTFLGAALTALIWSANWIMAAGDYSCCATLGGHN